ncbi:hypothetical protein K8O61_13225 [Xanthomonas cerealis pv. cerealis]|uniref:hypothetical protein n=1 Tax=Xanthomonas cerealis TaxID=3390025 RepID=UPI001F3ECFAA|nr:hypothetical protein [Xanthomonas translucens]UKE68448.1 hypothetical protein K8O61_13225 [Xanthomonas translucens pv. pistacia]
MNIFYRKEREHVFQRRFERVSNMGNLWRLRARKIFECKLGAATKTLVVTVNGNTSKYACTVQGNALHFRKETGPGNQVYLVAEAQIPGILQGADDVRNALMVKLCRDHAAASTHSPLISGCIVNNFQMSAAYPGRNLALHLKHRTPFANPHVSGLEREYCLVGRVTSDDCEFVKYLGSQTERLFAGELVNFPGSRLPRP